MEWKITPVQEQCTTCDHPFEEGEPFFSTLHLDEEGAARKDWCASCFDPAENDERIFWKTKRTGGDAAGKRIVDFGILREFFFRMISHGGPAFVPMAYLVGLVLVRKKFLRFVDFISRGDRDLMRVQRRKGEPYFDVEMPLLDEAGIARLKEKLADLLSADIGDDFDLASLEMSDREEESEEPGADPLPENNDPPPAESAAEEAS